MPLPRLDPASAKVDVQRTSVDVDVDVDADAAARFVRGTWDEATSNGGAPFDAVVVGAGMCGAYCAAKIVRLHPGKRVLVLDAGDFLVTEHVQNLADVGFAIPAPIPRATNGGMARELV